MRERGSVDAVRVALRGRPVLVDVAVAGALAALVTWEILTTDVDGPRGWLLPLGLLTTAPLAARRRLPLLTVVVVSGALVALGVVSTVQEP